MRTVLFDGAVRRGGQLLNAQPVAETAAVIGRVTLEEGVSVWYGAVLRGDADEIRVGSGSNIQDNCTVICLWTKC